MLLRLTRLSKSSAGRMLQIEGQPFVIPHCDT
jgi:hypothetical protein